MTGTFIESNFGIVNASQGVDVGVADQRWAPWAGDPSPVSGDTALDREVNALYADYRKRAEYLTAAERAPKDSQAGLEILHQSYLEAVQQAAQAGESNSLAGELRDQRDTAETAHKGTAWQEAIDGASEAVERAREAYVAFIEGNFPALLAERLSDAKKVPNEIAKLEAEYDAKLAPLQARWATLWDDSRAIVGNLHPFTRDDLPALGNYSEPPTPSQESIERHAALTSPAPASVPVPLPRREHAELTSV
jgi:hypothetical protein